jgi:hypothetical protein
MSDCSGIHRLRRLITVAAGLAAVCGLSSGAARPPVIINQAADAVVNYLKLDKPLGQGATKEMATAALHNVVDQYQGLGVSHLFWNVNYQRVAYRSTVWPSYWDVDAPNQNTTSFPRKYYELHKLGIDDVFAIVIPRSRERGVSPWVSLRMNDHHFTRDPNWVSKLFSEHPEMRTQGGKGLFNYAKTEVREHYLKLIAEVLERYDVDGLELDWMRTPYNFDVEEIDRGRDIHTAFVRDVRRRTQAAAARRGHPVRLAVRVPGTPEFAHGMGFDAVAWAKEGLLDMLIPSGWTAGYPDIPVEQWRARLGPDAPPCLIIPGTDRAYGCGTKGLIMGLNVPAMRGFTASMFDRGAEGIYLFNHFMSADMPLRSRTPQGKTQSEFVMGDLLRAAGDFPGALAATRLHVLTYHDRVPASSGYRSALPAKLAPQQLVTLKIHTGPQPEAGRYIVRVGLGESDDLAGAKVSARINGTLCRGIDDQPRPAKADFRPGVPKLHVCEIAPRVMQFEAPLAAVARGYNTLELSVEQGGPQTAVWLEVSIEP